MHIDNNHVTARDKCNSGDAGLVMPFVDPATPRSTSDRWATSSPTPGQSRQSNDILKWDGSSDNDSVVIASPSIDAWMLGVALYQLFSGGPLFHTDFGDNITDQEELLKLARFDNEFKSKKGDRIPDLLARNVVTQLLNKDSRLRPTMHQIRYHPFFTGRQAARLVGQEAEFDVFLSYRVASDRAYVTSVYKRLTEAGLKVWWDAECLQPGELWEVGFCKGLIRSRIFVPLLSRNATNCEGNKRQNFTLLTPDSPCDNVLLEHMMALDLFSRGLIKKVYPLLIGDEMQDPETGGRFIGEYFKAGCCPSFLPSAPRVVVASVVRKLVDHLDTQGLGTLTTFC